MRIAWFKNYNLHENHQVQSLTIYLLLQNSVLIQNDQKYTLSGYLAFGIQFLGCLDKVDNV